MKNTLNEEISRIKSVMGLINERKAVYNDFIKKNGFKVDCSDCDGAPIHYSKNTSYDDKLYGGEFYDATTNNYYLIINNKNSCSSFPLSVADYDKSSVSLSRPVNASGDALIVGEFDYDSEIITDVNVILCQKLYPKEKTNELVKLYKQYVDASDGDYGIYEGTYWIVFKQLTYSDMENIIEWLNKNNQPITQLRDTDKPKDEVGTNNVA